jgi:hypothetical protein
MTEPSAHSHPHTYFLANINPGFVNTYVQQLTEVPVDPKLQVFVAKPTYQMYLYHVDPILYYTFEQTVVTDPETRIRTFCVTIHAHFVHRYTRMPVINFDIPTVVVEYQSDNVHFGTMQYTTQEAAGTFLQWIVDNYQLMLYNSFNALWVYEVLQVAILPDPEPIP